MASIRLVDSAQAPLLARPYYEAGHPGPIVAALAHVPELLEACMAFLGAVFGPTALPARTKELVILRTSARLRCRYCVEAHSVVALDTGLSPAEVRALRGGGPLTDAFARPAELALLEWVDAVAGGTGPVDPVRRAALAPTSPTPRSSRSPCWWGSRSCSTGSVPPSTCPPRRRPSGAWPRPACERAPKPNRPAKPGSRRPAGEGRGARRDRRGGGRRRPPRAGLALQQLPLQPGLHVLPHGLGPRRPPPGARGGPDAPAGR